MVVAAVAVATALILGLSGYFAGPDPAIVGGTGSPIGQAFPDQGDAVLAPGARRPRYDSTPPTSGPHVRRWITADGRVLTDDQLLSALAAGDVVVAYGTRRPPAGLRTLAGRLAGPFSPALAASGQAVILTRRAGTAGLIVLAWTRMARVSAPSDALLTEFVRTWLGRGAPGAR